MIQVKLVAIIEVVSDYDAKIAITLYGGGHKFSCTCNLTGGVYVTLSLKSICLKRKLFTICIARGRGCVVRFNLDHESIANAKHLVKIVQTGIIDLYLC